MDLITPLNGAEGERVVSTPILRGDRIIFVTSIPNVHPCEYGGTGWIMELVALTGTNLRLVLRNMEIKNVIATGIFTDQCVSSTVRSLADESFNVVVVEDCCAAATEELHLNELKTINMIYCHVVQSEDIEAFLA